MLHPIFIVKDEPENIEQLGTKEKFWYLNSEGESYLFKFSRENTGEHWSEKIAEQLCKLLNLPHATYELAKSSHRRNQEAWGVISKNFVAPHQKLIMGNEALSKYYSSTYPSPASPGHSHTKHKDRYHTKQHTVNRVLQYLEIEQISIEPQYNTVPYSAIGMFCGYLLLDALISNQDRHHENWGILLDSTTNTKYLSPTFDHAASLGRELTDKNREAKLKSKDKNQSVTFFVSKARSGLYLNENDPHTLITVNAFYEAVKNHPTIKNHWLEKLHKLSESQIKEILAGFTEEVMSSISKEFALKMIIENRKRILTHE